MYVSPESRCNWKIAIRKTSDIYFTNFKYSDKTSTGRIKVKQPTTLLDGIFFRKWGKYKFILNVVSYNLENAVGRMLEKELRNGSK